MALTVKVEPIDRDIQLLISQDLSPAAQSAMFATYARQQRDAALETDAEALGVAPAYTTTVDGSRGASEDSVRPNGTIAYEFELINDIFGWISDQLERASPIGSVGDKHSGLFRAEASSSFYADGALANPNNPPSGATEYVFANAVPYARKIEQGESPQAPEGVYEAVATLAAAKFSKTAKITFGYRAVTGGLLGEWESSSSAAAHASRHGRRSNAQDWLTRQPAIIITLK